MKKIIAISSILILSSGIFLIKKHQDYKNLQKEISLDLQKNASQISAWIQEDKEKINEYISNEVYRNSSVFLIKTQQESIVTNKNLLSTIEKGINQADEKSKIDFFSFVFNVFLK